MNTHMHLHVDARDSPHLQDKGDHRHRAGIYGFISGLLHPNSHVHGDLATDRGFVENQTGIRTVWIALAVLATTSILQLAIAFVSGSVALFADSAHNIGDALNSIPLLIAFYLARKVATRQYIYGYGRAEDIER